jgi:hypothetical protein
MNSIDAVSMSIYCHEDDSEYIPKSFKWPSPESLDASIALLFASSSTIYSPSCVLEQLSDAISSRIPTVPANTEGNSRKKKRNDLLDSQPDRKDDEMAGS